MKAVIMAGGQGTRLRPLTSNQPKPMLPVVNRPMMEHIVKLLIRYGFKDMIATLQFLPSLISNYFGDGSEWGASMHYSTEFIPLGTAGSVKNSSQLLDETFLVISGDALTDIDLTSVVDFHRRNRAMATLTLIRVENPLEFGIVVTDAAGRIERFLEKPNWGQVFSDTINTGIYVLEPEVLEHIPEGQSFDFSKDLFPFLLSEGYPLYGFVADGYWCDIGNFEQYTAAHKDILDRKVRIDPPGFRMAQNVWVGEGVDIEDGVELRGPLVIGDHCKIERGSVIREYSVLGHNVVVKQDTFVHRALIYDNSYIGTGCHVRGCVVGKNCDLKGNVRLEEGVVVGDECLIGENVLVNHDVKIYPFKTVETGATVNTSIIWESKGLRTLFGKKAVSGIMNIDITPEQALRIAMAYGSSLPMGSTVVTSRDASRSARTLKRAIITGLNASGINVSDLEVSPSPVNRFAIGTERAMGGVDVRISAFDPQSIEIRFFDEQGVDIDEGGQRDIEKVFYQANFRRAFVEEIGAILFPPRLLEMYSNSLLAEIDIDRLRKKRFRVAVDYAFSSASMVMPSIFGRIGCDALSLNNFTDEKKVTLSQEELASALKNLSQLVKSSEAEVGVLMDNAGERLYLLDDHGRQIHPQATLILFVKLLCETGRRGKIAVPVSISSHVERIAGEYGNEVIRTKVSRSDLMRASLDKDVIFAGAGSGGYIFPSFLPTYDAMASTVMLLDSLSVVGRPISELVDELPRIHLLSEEIPASWDHKGLIMRRLVEEVGEGRLELIDGVKVYVDGTAWVLVLPDPDEPTLHLICEAEDDTRAALIIGEYTKKIVDIVGG
ncbi:MAG: mannose-1-phosphate guanyltransferase [Actinobacteria bacterium]|jgi:mannose-1-phosphate guanylyltransferase/phosphomannomutase|nr:MAG: mannose-1-phosphate guanyltransferase [Actinomycetota bacterium]